MKGNKKRRKRLVVWLLVLIPLTFILLRYSGCLGGDNSLKVVLEEVANKDIIESVDASGKIYPETEIKIKADVSGEIVELPIEEGDSVIAGQLLMKIDPVIYQTQVTQAQAEMDRTRSSAQNATQVEAQAKAQYLRAQTDYNRNLKLYEDKVISRAEFDQYKTEYLSAEAAYKAAQATASGGHYGIESARSGLNQSKENLNKTIIRAPASGIISQLLVKKGERVVGTQQMDGTQIMTIADLGKMEVRVEISENDIAKVNIGDTVKIQVDAFKDQHFKGIVSKIAVSSVVLNSVGGMSGGSGTNDEVTNYTVHILILTPPSSSLATDIEKPADKFLFKPGMSAGVEIQTRKETNVLSVPINAVTTRSVSNSSDKAPKTQTIVFVYDSGTGKVVAREVQVGIQDNEYIQVISGLKKGEQVVVAPFSLISRTLEDGMQVKPVDKEKLYQILDD